MPLHTAPSWLASEVIEIVSNMPTIIRIGKSFKPGSDLFSILHFGKRYGMMKRKLTVRAVEKNKSWGHNESKNALKYQVIRDMKRQGI